MRKHGKHASAVSPGTRDPGHEVCAFLLAKSAKLICAQRRDIMKLTEDRNQLRKRIDESVKNANELDLRLKELDSKLDRERELFHKLREELNASMSVNKILGFLLFVSAAINLAFLAVNFFAR